MKQAEPTIQWQTLTEYCLRDEAANVEAVLAKTATCLQRLQLSLPVVERTCRALAEALQRHQANRPLTIRLLSAGLEHKLQGLHCSFFLLEKSDNTVIELYLFV